MNFSSLMWFNESPTMQLIPSLSEENFILSKRKWADQGLTVVIIQFSFWKDRRVPFEMKVPRVKKRALKISAALFFYSVPNCKSPNYQPISVSFPFPRRIWVCLFKFQCLKKFYFVSISFSPVFIGRILLFQLPLTGLVNFSSLSRDPDEEWILSHGIF